MTVHTACTAVVAVVGMASQDPQRTPNRATEARKDVALQEIPIPEIQVCNLLI